jgi:hypothetical protein
MARKRPRAVREPIQVYLDTDERAMLDRVAEETGLSRAEVLRRGLRSYAVEQGAGRSPMLEFMEWMKQQDFDLPADLSERHDDYLAEIYEEEATKPPPPKVS